MSKLNGASVNTGKHAQAVDHIASVIAQNGFKNSGLTANVIGLESLQPEVLANVQRTHGEIIAAMQDSSVFKDMAEGLTQEQINVGLEALSMVIMAGGNPQDWHTAAKAPQADASVRMVNANQGTLDYSTDYALEGFEAASLNQYIAQSAYIAFQAAVQGNFEETFFPIQVVPAGTNGVDVSITTAKIFSATARNANGTPTAFNKTNIIKAYVDSKLLENNVTKIQPVATGTTTVQDPFLVPDADVTTTQVIIDGYTVNTRPLAIGKTADIIGVSQTAALLAAGSMNETDTLDNSINVGKLYYTVDFDGDTLNVAYDVSSQMGSLLQRQAEDTDRSFLTTFKAKVVLKKGMVKVGGAGSVATIEADMGSVETMVGEVTISARANTEFGTMEVFANNPVWTKAYDIDNTEVPVPADTTFTVIGYMPAARRTNANIRSRGTIIDSTTTVTYRFSVPLQSPIISQQPINAPVNTAVEGLVHAERVRNNNNAVKALLALEQSLQSTNGLPVGTGAMGVELVEPTYSNTPLNVEEIVVQLASKDSQDNLRGALTAAIKTTVYELIQRSNYLAALEYYVGNNSDYEVIVVTDSVIFPWLMESGDARTLGAEVNYKITQSLNSDVKGKIYVSLRRKTRDGQMNPLDFGAFLYTPSLTYEPQVNRSGATIRELHNVPRGAYYCTLPILGVIEVTGIVELFTVA